MSDPAPDIRITRTGDDYRLECEQWLPRPVEEVFPFFADAANLQRLTPPHLHFRILTPQPVEMREGTVIEYRLRLYVIPIRWQSVISLWDPPRAFADEQRAGPYKRWHHTHTFNPDHSGTLCRDEVRYQLPGGPLAPLANALLVKRDLTRIFTYRSRVLTERFGDAAPKLTPEPLPA